MSSHSFVKAKSNWCGNVKYKPPTVDKRGGKAVKLIHNGQWLTLQIPLMFSWGVNEWVDEGTGVAKYSLSLQFNPEKSDAEHKFLEQVKQLQEKILDDAVNNSKDWFGKSKMNRQVAEALFNPLLKYPKKKDGSGEPDLDRNPTLNVKLPYWNGKFNCELFDMKGQCTFGPNRDDTDGQTPMTLVPKGSSVKGLIQCGGLWFVGGKFGVTWRLQQACVRPPRQLVGQGKCMLMDDSDDEAAEEELNQKDEEAAEEDDEQPTAPSFDVNSSDDGDDDGQDEDEVEEEEDDDEATVVVEAPKKVKKKIVRRKKKSSGD
jgi:hypothetical protein